MSEIIVLILNMCFPVFAGMVLLLEKKEVQEEKLARKALTAMIIAACLGMLNITGGENQL